MEIKICAPNGVKIHITSIPDVWDYQETLDYLHTVIDKLSETEEDDSIYSAMADDAERDN